MSILHAEQDIFIRNAHAGNMIFLRQVSRYGIKVRPHMHMLMSIHMGYRQPGIHNLLNLGIPFRIDLRK